MKADKRILMFFALIFLFASAWGSVYAESDEASCFEPILVSGEESFLDLEELGFESVFPYDENIAIAFDDEMSDVSSLVAEEIIIAKGIEKADRTESEDAIEIGAAETEFVLNGFEGEGLIFIDALAGETSRAVEIGSNKVSIDIVPVEEAFNGVKLQELGFEEIDEGFSDFIKLTRTSTEEK